jgi:PAS domain S-box-containing protein
LSTTAPYPLWKRALRSASVYTVAVAVLLELLSLTPLYVPNPGVVLILPVIYAAFREGVASGLFSAAIALAYQVHFVVSRHGDAAIDPRRDAIVAIVLPITALVVGMLRNRLDGALTEERRLRLATERERSRSLAILDTITDGFIALNRRWEITFANRRAGQILGRTQAELIGRNAFELFPESVGSSIHETLKTAMDTREPIEAENYYAPADRWMEMRAHSTEDELSVYFRDVTARRRAQDSISFQSRLLDAIGQAVIATDLDGKVIYWNRAAEVLFGWTAEEVVGKSGIAITHASYSDVEDVRMFSRMRSGRSWMGEVQLLAKLGRVFPAAVSDTPIVGEDGTLLGMVRVVTDLTWRKTIEEQQRFLSNAGAALAETLDAESTLRTVARLAVPALADCCLVDLVEPDGEIRRMEVAHVNPEKEQIAREIRKRYPLEPASNHPVVDAIRSGKSQLIPRLSDHYMRSIAFDSRHLGMLRDLAYTSGMFIPLVARGRKLGALSLLSSESGKEYASADLQVAEELARRAAIAIENARLYDAAVEASRAKSDFLAVMSHELRTPLTTVMGYTDLLLAGVPRPLEGKAFSYVERIRTAAWHLLGIIEQILIYARLEAGREQLHPERANISDVLRDAAALIEPVAAEKGLGFHALPGPAAVVETDPTKLRQILLNLLSNAVKFTDKGQVTLEGITDDSTVTFIVRDTGIGIAAEHIDKVFDPFWQVDQSSTRQVGGTGLGLSVARRLTRLLGGELAVKSTPGEGAQFTVRLPLRWGAKLDSEGLLVLAHRWKETGGDVTG